MAKMSNTDALQDATAICDRLDLVENLNLSSAAILRLARDYIEKGDGRSAFDHAKSADFMHYFCTDMKMITKDSASYQTMINDPTSALYRG